jgi:hypothetical protein
MRLSDEQARAAREAAWRLLDRFYVSRPQDIRERGVAYKLDVLVTDGPILTADAWLVCSEKRGLVRVRSSIPWRASDGSASRTSWDTGSSTAAGSRTGSAPRSRCGTAATT